MAYRTPKTSWTDADSFQTTDMERVEQNIDYLAGNGSEQQLGTSDNVQFADVTVDSVTSAGAISGTTGTFSGAVSGTTGTFSSNVSGVNGSFSGAISGASVNTGHGAAECYDMDQPTRTTDSVTFQNIEVNGVLKNGAINPSLQDGGIAAGLYTGSTAAESNLPVGSIILVLVSSILGANVSMTIYHNGTGVPYRLTGSTLLSGQWRSRGSLVSGTDNYALAQRIS